MPKRIVICADGTWNTPDQKDRGEVCPSNVAKIAACIADRGSDGLRQMVYYDRGVGTEWYDRIRGGISGVGIAKNIKEAYRFLIENYEEGDELFFFGFSRGAYTVRSAAGLIRNSGLLLKANPARIDDAYNLYRRRDSKSHPASVESVLFRKTYSRAVRIKCIGVWDTVGALGIPVQEFDILNKFLGVEFHDVKLSSYVDNAFQALAIDEKRKAFAPSIWKQQEHATNQRLEQVWFSGVHTNIGGGYQNTGLSDIAFEWMRSKAESCGLVFDDRGLADVGIAVKRDWAGELRDSKKGLYTLICDYIRPIGAVTGGNETVHAEAIRRLEKDAGYKPENLQNYLSRAVPAKAADEKGENHKL